MNKKQLQDLETITMAKMVGSDLLGHVKFWLVVGGVLFAFVGICKGTAALQDSVNSFFMK
jgi:hypothetical protein